jgi:transcriptional antiterminator NusG
MEKRWFILHVLAGYEKDVKEGILRRLKENGMEDKVDDIFIPKTDENLKEEGSKKKKEKIVFPGYILIHMEYIPPEERDKDLEKAERWSKLWKIVRYTPYVMGILGTRNEPTPVPDKEVEELKKRIEKGELRALTAYDVGDKVRVKDGPFTNFNGEVEAVYLDKKRLRVLISIFGRSTPVELEFSQVEKIS